MLAFIVLYINVINYCLRESEMKINAMFIINKLIKSVLGNDNNSTNYVAIATHLHYERPCNYSPGHHHDRYK